MLYSFLKFTFPPNDLPFHVCRPLQFAGPNDGVSSLEKALPHFHFQSTERFCLLNIVCLSALFHWLGVSRCKYATLQHWYTCEHLQFFLQGISQIYSTMTSSMMATMHLSWFWPRNETTPVSRVFNTYFSWLYSKHSSRLLIPSTISFGALPSVLITLYILHGST